MGDSGRLWEFVLSERRGSSIGGWLMIARVPKTRKQERFALVAVISKFATKSAIALLQVMSATTEASRLGAGRARRAAQNEKDSKQGSRISDFDVVVCDCRATGKSFWQRSNSVVAKKIHHGPLQVTKIIK